MKKDIEVAVVFTRTYLKERNITILIPQKIITGKCIQDSKFFINSVDNKAFKNMDEVNYQNQEYGFYYATTLKELEKLYETKDLQIILQKYLDDICSKVHYYVAFDEENFDSYLLKSSSIEDFNKEYSVNFKYNYKDITNGKNKTNKEIINNYNTHANDLIGKDISKIKDSLQDEILFQDVVIDKIIKALYTNYILGTKNNNIIISGPTGVGKTEALKAIVNGSKHSSIYCSLPREYACDDHDASYILSSILLRLREDAISNNKLNSHSIIILDDFDKLDEFQKYDFQEELLNFLKCGLRSVRTNQRIVFDANKITFIICGNFDNVNKIVNVPQEFFKNDNFKIDKNDISLDYDELANKHFFLEEILPYFQTEVFFNKLDIDKSKEIIKTLHNKTMKLYFNQLQKQGIKSITLTDEFIDKLANQVYSECLNLKNLDKEVVKIFTDVMIESLKYLDVSTNLTINEEILQNSKKGYQFTLKK